MARLTRLTLIELRGYREWTESLGDDREWAIQLTQARIYRAAQEEAKEHGGFVVPLRYDFMVLLSSNLQDYSQKAVIDAVASESPVPVRAASACAPTPLDALRAAQGMLGRVEPGGLEVEGCSAREETAVAHVDVDNISYATLQRGAYEAFLDVVRLHHVLAEEAAAAGALVQYLGGDNILVVLPPAAPRLDAERLLARTGEMAPRGMTLKAGVGIAPTPREALSLAARALHDIRSRRAHERIVVYEAPP
ncbi:MAG: GTP cyclohydrolase IIa [Desulfurococcales archaeon]|nr:GTP cyclohydrolase IIa [Desulfurococcales archaeon]